MLTRRMIRQILAHFAGPVSRAEARWDAVREALGGRGAGRRAA